MADFTKSSIKQTFLLLLKKSPLSEISVKDITSECGLSRNSFFYHYRDIPELIDNIVEEYASSIVEKYSTFGSVGEYFNYIIDILLAHKKEAKHIYRPEFATYTEK